MAAAVTRCAACGHRARTLGRPLQHPILLAPVAYQTLAHARGEIEVARAAAATDSGAVPSTWPVAALRRWRSRRAKKRWFQLYFQETREITLDLLRRAEAAAHKVLVVTLDSAIKLPCSRAERPVWMPDDVQAANLAHYPPVAPIRC